VTGPIRLMRATWVVRTARRCGTGFIASMPSDPLASATFSTPGRLSRHLDTRRLGWRLHGAAGAAHSTDPCACAGGRSAACRRYHRARVGPRSHRDWPIMELRARRSPVCRTSPAGRVVPVFPGLKGRTSGRPSQQLDRHSAGRCLCGL